MTNVCRLCLFQMPIHTLSGLKDDVQRKAQIKFVIPEVDLDMTTALTLCNLCSPLLSSAYEFKRKCLITEQTLKEYINDCGLSLPIDLNTYKESTEQILTEAKDEVTEEVEYSTVLDNVETKFNADITCDRCNNVFYDNEAYNVHNEKCSLDRGDECEETKKSIQKCFVQEELHKSNEKDKASPSHRKTYSCPICYRTISRKYQLDLHMETHSDNIVVCEICGKKCSGRLLLKKHTSAFHKNANVCETCGRKCSSKGVLEEHMRTHTGERPYRCEICGKGFAQGGTLQTHKKSIHGTGTPYVCGNCGKAFRARGNLVMHMRVHQYDKNEKTVRCEFENCGKTFYTEQHCKAHMIWHGERKELCTLCGMAFFNKHGLRKHMKTHTGERPYECETCHKAFGTRFNLKVHLKSHKAKIKIGKESSYNQLLT